MLLFVLNLTKICLESLYGGRIFVFNGKIERGYPVACAAAKAGVMDFSGGILITTTAVENILYAFNDLYLPDFKEYINAKNFYLKTQLYVEKKFFPGSIQKKTFLSSIVRQIKNNEQYDYAAYFGGYLGNYYLILTFPR